MDYLGRVERIHFTGEWLRPFRTGQLPSARLPEPTAQLTRLGLPTLLLHGERDMIFPAALAFRAQAEIPTARAVVLPSAAHMAHIDQPAAWLAAVARFLATEVP
jgi:pimeloyl-ACP methyl ester carboxylesterase